MRCGARGREILLARVSKMAVPWRALPRDVRPSWVCQQANHKIVAHKLLIRKILKQGPCFRITRPITPLISYHYAMIHARRPQTLFRTLMQQEPLLETLVMFLYERTPFRDTCDMLRRNIHFPVKSGWIASHCNASTLSYLRLSYTNDIGVG